MRYAFVILLALHGCAHLVGFVVPWRFVASSDLPYKTTILAGRIDLGDAGIRVVAIVWLHGTVAFFVAAGGVIVRAPWVQSFVVISAVASAVLCALEWPQARIGLLVDIGLLAAITFIRAAT